jgi:hypothetical protein
MPILFFGLYNEKLRIEKCIISSFAAKEEVMAKK